MSGEVEVRWTPPGGSERRCRFSETLTIGRGPDCRILLSDPAASRRHARLTLSARGLEAENTSSGNRFLGPAGAPLKAGDSLALQVGDVLTLAGQRVTIASIELPRRAGPSHVRCSRTDCRRRIPADQADCPWCGTSTAFAETDLGGS